MSTPQVQPRMQPASAAPAPTERSISPEMITAVMPKAMIPIIETARSTLRRLLMLAKPGAEDHQEHDQREQDQLEDDSRSSPMGRRPDGVIG